MAVTGLGAVTAIGRNGGILEEPDGRDMRDPAASLFDASAYRTQTAAEVSEIPDGFLTPAERRRMSRADCMASRRREAIAASGLDLSREDPTRVGVILGGGPRASTPRRSTSST